jgi:CheY-like chemotaxis protein/anti-sigma regulatory factor (Ser/Thr protein kinase)
VAGDGKEALRIYLEREPAMLIADVQLPLLDGLALLEDIRRRDADVFFILMTGQGSVATARQALELRASNYLVKPLRFDTVVSQLDKYAALLKARSVRKEIFSRIVRREVNLRLENRLDLVSEASDFLVREAGDALAPEFRQGIHLGLYELIVNAIEHGNLGISFEEKRRCLEESPYRLTELVLRRLTEPRLAARRVRIAFRMEPGRLEWTVEDEGEGFESNDIPDPLTSAEEVMNGRGIFLARFHFDELSYLGLGNRVRAVKLVGTLAEERT